MKKSFYSNNSIYTYLTITFGYTWLLWGSQALYINDIFTKQPIKLLANLYTYGAWGPLLAALFIALKSNGIKGIKTLFSQTFNFNFSKKWLLPTFFLFPLIIGSPLLLLLIFNKPIPPVTALESPMVIIVAFFVILFTAGPLQEEYGWRGTLQSQLQNKLNPLYASLVTGAIWGIWHFPLFFIPDQGFYYDKPIWGLLLSTILISVLFGWIYNNTKRNLLLMLVFHTMWNYSHYLFPTINSETGGLLYFIILALSVLLVVAKDKKLKI